MHVHCRNDDGTNTHSIQRFRDAYEAIRAQSDLIVQFSTGGAIGMTPQERSSVLELRPEMATLTCGSVNFGDDIFENSFPIMRGISEQDARVAASSRTRDLRQGAHRAMRAGSRARDCSRFPSMSISCSACRAALEATVQNLADLVDALPARLHVVGRRRRSRSSSPWPWLRSRWAATSAWVSKTTSTTAGVASPETRSWLRGSRASPPRRPAGRDASPGPQALGPCRAAEGGRRGRLTSNNGATCSPTSCAGSLQAIPLLLPISVILYGIL